jgi:hypothetical protein
MNTDLNIHEDELRRRIGAVLAYSQAQIVPRALLHGRCSSELHRLRNQIVQNARSAAVLGLTDLYLEIVLAALHKGREAKGLRQIARAVRKALAIALRKIQIRSNRHRKSLRNSRIRSLVRHRLSLLARQLFRFSPTLERSWLSIHGPRPPAVFWSGHGAAFGN